MGMSVLTTHLGLLQVSGHVEVRDQEWEEVINDAAERSQVVVKKQQRYCQNESIEKQEDVGKIGTDRMRQP